MLATTKYNTEPRVATERYFSLAVFIFSSVTSASLNLCLITPDVTYVTEVNKGQMRQLSSLFFE